MSKSPYSVEQRLAFINECYTSGLSVYAWCRENDISSGTFYSWIHHLKKQGCQLPDAVPTNLRDKPIRESHEVVKVNIVDDSAILKTDMNHPYRMQEEIPCNTKSSICIRVADVTIDLNESVNPAFLSQVLKAVRYNV